MAKSTQVLYKKRGSANPYYGAVRKDKNTTVLERGERGGGGGKAKHEGLEDFSWWFKARSPFLDRERAVEKRRENKEEKGGERRGRRKGREELEPKAGFAGPEPQLNLKGRWEIRSKHWNPRILTSGETRKKKGHKKERARFGKGAFLSSEFLKTVSAGRYIPYKKKSFMEENEQETPRTKEKSDTVGKGKSLEKTARRENPKRKEIQKLKITKNKDGKCH